MLFRYLAARWKYRGPSAKRYIRAGLGLESRARALSTYWTDHLSRTRAAQARWARTSSGRTLTLLGAGPLLDLNTTALAGKFELFRMVDANPLLVPAWQRMGKPVEPVIVDITNCLEPWCNRISAFKGTWEQALETIRDLGQAPVPAYSVSTDGLLSLNILSQLEIVWQEALEPILKKRFGRRFVSQREQEWLGSTAPSSQVLIEQHLAALEASAARNVLLISDVEYIEYTGRRYVRKHWGEPPLQWTEAGWQADDGIQFDAMPALEGVVLSRETFARWMPSYDLEWHESWLWHIAPCGTEGTKYGKLHRVAAFALRYRASTAA